MSAFDVALEEVADSRDGYAPGATTERFYDGAGRVLVRQVPNLSAHPQLSSLVSSEVFERNALGQITAARSYMGDLGGTLTPLASVLRDQDSIGRLHQESFDFETLGDVTDVTSVYGQGVDLRSGLQLSNGLELSYSWDAAGRMTGIDWTPDAATTSADLADYGHFGFDTAFRRVRYRGAAAGVTSDTLRSYDSFGRLNQIVDQRSDQATPFAQYDFEYDGLDRLVKEKYAKLGTPGAEGDVFAYDEFGRLRTAWLAAADIDTFDAGTDAFVQKLTYGGVHGVGDC